MEAAYPGIIQNPDKTKGKMKKLVYKPPSIKLAKLILDDLKASD